jgi:general secretion pathway protein G
LASAVSSKVSHLTKGNTVLANIHRIQRNRELNGERGFTLIELLIVIVVLGILAAIVVFALGGVTSSSAISACQTDAQTVAVAVAAEQAQTPNIAPTYSLSGTTVTSNLVPNYIASWPSSSYYSVGLGSNNQVQVALVTGDPAYATPSGTGTPAAPGATMENFNSTGGSTVYTYPTTLGWTGSSYTSIAGKGICAGV